MRSNFGGTTQSKMQSSLSGSSLFSSWSGTSPLSESEEISIVSCANLNLANRGGLTSTFS